MKKVKVKILKYIDAMVPGQVVEVEESVADALCYVGNNKNIRAMKLAEYEKAEKEAQSITEDTTVADGIKNVTDIPAEWDKRNPSVTLPKKEEVKNA